MFDWSAIDTVLLDMDGTLLDLHFDNHFWLEHVPQRYAEQRGMSVEAAKEELGRRYRAVEGTLDWYCVDYWSRELGLDIPLLKAEVEHLIQVHPHVLGFLDLLRRAGKARVLVTNAHQKALQLKMKKTALGDHLDLVVSAHDLGLPKENPAFWDRLQQQVRFDAARTLFVDDSVPVLRSARTWGIRHLLHILRPDTRQPPRREEEFPSVADFRPLADGLRLHAHVLELGEETGG
ncbi:MAG TPA: GMP/IMP nucleotidase [Thiolapillus brandeum]|uniref:GMP/IMP nucleotidase n=1 Tax=Thiolapillus brandeum TaxID=1076588 RepID=A0A7C5MX40_9GAMM|nr:GMP/IMP nucleotidase [Thiolapillus brandeum]